MKDSTRTCLIAATGIAVAIVWILALYEASQSNGGMCGHGKVLVRGVIGFVCVDKGGAP